MNGIQNIARPMTPSCSRRMRVMVRPPVMLFGRVITPAQYRVVFHANCGGKFAQFPCPQGCSCNRTSTRVRVPIYNWMGVITGYSWQNRMRAKCEPIGLAY